MTWELKRNVINMKTLSQDIENPIVIGEGEANGRSLRVIFTQEAAARFTPTTKVYLSWRHKEKDIKGYNVFTEVENTTNNFMPPTWEIFYPKAMLYEGNVIACLEIIDDINISVSKNFVIHIVQDPDDGSDFLDSNDYTVFQQATLQMNNLAADVENEFGQIKEEFNDMKDEFDEVKEAAFTAQNMVNNLSDRWDELSNRHDLDLTFVEF